MRRGVVIRVVTVAFFGNGNVSSSPQAERPRSGIDLGDTEKKMAANDRKTTKPIHRDFIALTSVLFVAVTDGCFFLPFLSSSLASASHPNKQATSPPLCCLS